MLLIVFHRMFSSGVFPLPHLVNNSSLTRLLIHHLLLKAFRGTPDVERSHSSLPPDTMASLYHDARPSDTGCPLT